MKKFRCKIGWHKLIDKEYSRTKNVSFGFAGCELPGMRVRQECELCGYEKYISLNLAMPNYYLYKEQYWK